MSDKASPAIAITLTTDFGLADGYVGTMKGVIHSINAKARLIDLSHDISPQRIGEAAFVLYRAYRFFPPDTVHLAVVDPGVGSQRKAIVLDTSHGRFVAPDNGLLTYVYQAERQLLASANLVEPFAVSPFTELAADLPAPPTYEISHHAYRLSNLSNTFHGRDIFAPAAAHLSAGLEPSALGPQLDSINLLPNFAPQLDIERQRIVGNILHIDRFGNLITNIDASLIDRLNLDRTRLCAAVGRDNLCNIMTTYADADEGALLALVGSERLLEIAVRNGSAAKRLGARIGDPVAVLIN